MLFWDPKIVFLKKLALVIKLVPMESKNYLTIFLKVLDHSLHNRLPTSTVWERATLLETVELENSVCQKDWLGGCQKAHLTLLDPSLIGYQILKLNLFCRNGQHPINWCGIWTVDAQSTWQERLLNWLIWNGNQQDLSPMETTIEEGF